ncbi:unnamed protein product [Sphenostylis stenocarpa]|uniref:Neprosin PEP catalytic domain-containing protein n=1 Tax=Sphenostylis stenocarpa TaxID=92480 RepID=A0AA86SYC1_9FABA|nr:unnamed protein product [Sphenostylis stenocarpa]
MKKMMNTIIFVLCLVISGANSALHGVQILPEEDLELERQLKIINKPPIKVIHTEYGYIVDCIDIKKQPAFDHPLLKNHTLQRKPSFLVPTEERHDSPIFGLDKEECPMGTVPIRRTTKEDLIREKSLNYSIKIEGLPGVHVAELSLSSQFSPYYGVHGWNSVYNPKVAWNQDSFSHIWVQNGYGSASNLISLGWHVTPHFYGDYATHLYAAWTVEVRGTDIGYFPAALFSNLSSADIVGWGGRTFSPPGSPSPPMGSGYFPDRNFLHASFFKMISYQNESTISHGPEKYQLQYFIDKPSCFDLSYYGNLGGYDGYSLQFGGPGGGQCGV